MHAVYMQLCTYLRAHTGGKCVGTNIATNDWKMYTCATAPKCCDGFEAKVDADACTHVHTHDCTHVHASVFEPARAYTHSIPYVYQHRVRRRPRFNALRSGWDKWRSCAKNAQCILGPHSSTNRIYTCICILVHRHSSVLEHRKTCLSCIK